MNITDKRSSILKTSPNTSTMESIDVIDKRKLYVFHPVEPVDFEQFQSKNKMLLMNDPNRDLVMFPTDDTKLTKMNRDFRTENATVPKNPDAYSDNLLAKQSIDFFTSSWTVIEYKYSTYGGSYNRLPRKKDTNSTPSSQKFEVDEKPGDDDMQLSFASKGQSYFEGQLTVCSKEEYNSYKKRQEELTIKSAGTANDLANGPLLKEFCLKQLNDNTHQIEEIKKDPNPTILFLDSFQTVREIGKSWLLMERIDNMPEVYLFTGAKDNNQKWLSLVRAALQKEREAKSMTGTGSNQAEGDHADSARGCLQKYSQENEQTLNNWRSKDRQKILAVCPEIKVRYDEHHQKLSSHKFPIDLSKYDSSVDLHEDEHLHPFPNTPEIIQNYKITCSTLKMGLQAQIDAKSGVYRYDNPEPFFLSLCLIHIPDGRRISEEFFWDPNSPDISDMLKDVYQRTSAERPDNTPLDCLPSSSVEIPSEVFAKCKTCIVSSAYSEEQVYILVRVEKVLQGPISASTDKYTKSGSSFGPLSTFEVNGTKDSQPTSNDLKIGSQVHKAMSVFCRNIGQYRMPFAWGARPLANSKTEVRLFKHDSNKLSEEDLIKHIQQLSRQDRVIKWQSIPALLSIQVEPITLIKEENPNPKDSNDGSKKSSSPTYILNSSLIPMNGMQVQSSTPHTAPSLQSVNNLPSSQLSLLQPAPPSVIKQLESFLYDPSATATIRELENATGAASSASSHPMASSALSLTSNTASRENAPGSSLGSGVNSTSTIGLSKWGRDATGLPVPEALVLPHMDYKNLLYVYPKSLNYSNQNCFTRARTLACFVEVRDNDDENSIPLKIVCCRPSPYHNILEASSNTSSSHHDTNPHFTEEVKICLPPNITKKHHLLFKFYHVSCETAGNVKEKNAGKRHLETPVGFAWISLLSKENNITSGLHNLPVSTNLPSGYLNYKTNCGTDAPHLQWVDSQKNLFVVSIRLKSSIFTSSAHLHRFFRTCHQRLGQMQVQTLGQSDNADNKKNAAIHENGHSSKNNEPSDTVATLGEYHVGDVEVQNTLKGLAALDLCTLLQFLPALFNQMLQIITSVTSSEDVPKLAVCTLGILVSRITGKGPDKYQKMPDEIRLRNTRLLKSYIKFAFDSDRVAVYRTQSVHQTMVTHLLNFMSEKSLTEKLDCYRLVANNWVFFNIITKSMVQFLFNTNKVKADRFGENRFPAKFQTELFDLFNCITKWIFDMSQNSKATVNEHNDLARGANLQLAKFVCRLLNIMDRGFVFRMIHSYVNKFYERRKKMQEDFNLSLMEFEFIKELCHHEHYVQLNLPSLSRSYPKDVEINEEAHEEPGREFFLTEDFLQKHYLVGLLLQLVANQLSDPQYRQVIQYGQNNQVRPQPIVALRDLLGKHSLDDRYSTKAQQARIAQLYLPLVNLLIEYKSHLCMPGMFYYQSSNDAPTVDTATLSKISNSSRPQSLASETTSLFSHSTISGGVSNGHGASSGAGSVSIGGSSLDTISQSSQRYLTKEGKVESSVLNAIAGMSGGNVSLRKQAQSRRSGLPASSRQSNVSLEADQMSLGSTSTLTQSVLASLDAVTASYNEDQQLESSGESADQQPEVVSDGAPTGEDKTQDEQPPVIFTNLPSNISSGGGGSQSGSLTRSTGRGIRTFGALLEDDQGGSLKSGQTGGSYYEEGSRSLGRRGFTQYKKNQDAKNKKRAAPQPMHISEKNHKDILISFLHILSTVSQDSLTSLLNDMSLHNRLEFLDLLQLSIHYLHYKGHKNIVTYQSIGKCKINPVAKVAAHWRSQTRSSMLSEEGGNSHCEKEADGGSNRSLLEGNVSTEAGLIVIDVICLYLSIFKKDLFTYKADHIVFKKIVSLFIGFLQTNQSECTLKHLFASLRVFVTKFSKILFETSCSVIGDLCLEALNCLNRHLPSTRSEACGFLYTMMRVSYDEFGKQGFNRVHQQIIISVSKLAGRIERGFELSLSQLNMLAQTDVQRLWRSATAASGMTGQLTRSKNAGRQFVEEVSELTRCIRTVLMANTQMKEHENDPEMLVDLQYSLARSYASNPALRRTWLQAILKVHQDHKAKTEVAMVKIHEAALIAEYLKRKDCYPQGCSVFTAISPNIELEESDMKGNFEQLEVSYTEDDLQSLLREAAFALDDAGLWEVMPHVYRLIIPVYENARDLKELGIVYRHLAEGYQKAHHEEESGHRLFGEYYRVCFYGQPFETLAGKTFIYKTEKCTELASMCSRLIKIFQGKYKQKHVDLLTEAHVNRWNLDQSKAYIQVTHVQPYFEGQEGSSDRQTRFEKNFNISRFMFETPFVQYPDMSNDQCLLQSGSKRTDDLSAQWKRRTITTTEQTFPNLKRRLEVKSVREVDLSPIEGAMDAIKTKNNQLSSHLGLQTFSKLMDMHLQGALLTTVNQGPMAYAETFLRSENQPFYPTEKVNEFKRLFLAFLSTCLALLRLYQELMPNELLEKCKAMRQALDHYRVELSNLMNEEILMDDTKKTFYTKTVLTIVRESEKERRDSEV